jgi:hypothetical protein
LEARDPDPDIKEMLDRNAPRLAEQRNRMGLMMWAYKAFKRELDASDLETWREKLQLARLYEDKREGEPLEQLGTGAPYIVAAFISRDHWDELSDAEKTWCIERISTCVLAQSNLWQHVARMQRYDMAPDRSCAYAAVCLAAKELTDEQRSAVDKVLVAALTHPVEEARWYATLGAGELWARDRELAMRCVFAIAMEANVAAAALAREERKPFGKRREYEDIASEAAQKVRSVFWQPNALKEEAYDRLVPAEWHGADAQNRILAILTQAPEERLAEKAFGRAAQALVTSWKTKYDERGRGQKNIEADVALPRLLEEFVLRAPFETSKNVVAPIREAIDHCPDEVHSIIEGIVLAEDREPHTQQFWALWKLFAEGAKLAPWLEHIDDRHSSGAEVIRALFLGTWWKAETRHWRSLEGYDQNVHALFDDLAPSSCVMDAYVRFLYHVGERSFPDSFVRLANRLKIVEPKRLIRNSNTIYQLEIILQRYVYPKPLLLKARTDLRNSVLALLDVLIELGSSAAFKMRDDFITPISA